MKRSAQALATAVLVLATTTTYATLHSRASGSMVYDDDLNITWLADANFAKSSGYSSTGKMSWDIAVGWASTLEFGGYSDWRLPSTLVPDYACTSQAWWSYSAYNCSGSEIGHLFYIELGGNRDQKISDSGDPDLSLFTNLQDIYWSETDLSATGLITGPNSAYVFETFIGFQMPTSKEAQWYAWAVRDGDITSSIPEPPTIGLIFLAALLITVGNRALPPTSCAPHQI